MISNITQQNQTSLFTTLASDFVKGVKAIGQLALEKFEKRHEKRDATVKQYAKELVAEKIVSSNFIGRTHKNMDAVALYEETETVYEALETQRGEVTTTADSEVHANPFLKAMHVAKAAETSKLGNCGEMSSIAFFRLNDRLGISTQIEQYVIENGDHEFIVIGRHPASSPLDYRTWGPGCMIYDPWISEDGNIAYYSASEIETRMKCSTKMFEPGRYEQIQTRPLNLERDFLKSSHANLYSVKDFEIDMAGSQNVSAASLIKDLRAFRTSQNQVQLAEKMLTTIEEYLKPYELVSEEDATSDVRAVRVLGCQLSYFKELQSLANS